MILLSKKETVNNETTYFDFKKILKSGYTIREDKDRITQKFANGHRKQFLTEYTDVVITISLDTFDLDTTKSYLDKFTSGTYKYYSLNDKTYKEATFIIEEKPDLTMAMATDNNKLVDSYEVVLLKAGD
jgi:murein L,D-transpeptidase YafK